VTNRIDNLPSSLIVMARRVLRPFDCVLGRLVHHKAVFYAYADFLAAIDDRSIR
jgi:hypothetical protein